MVDAEVVVRAVDWTTYAIKSPWVFLLLNVFLLIVGYLMDIYSAIVIQVPLLILHNTSFVEEVPYRSPTSIVPERVPRSDFNERSLR